MNKVYLINLSNFAQNEDIINFQAQKMVSAVLLSLWEIADTVACVINDFWWRTHQVYDLETILEFSDRMQCTNFKTQAS